MRMPLLLHQLFHGELVDFGVSAIKTCSHRLVFTQVWGLAHIFGRRPVLVGGLLFFGVGSAMCGAAKNMK